MVSIPQGSVLAYRVLQLVVEEDGWGKPIQPCTPPPHPLPSGRDYQAVRSRKKSHWLGSMLVRPPKDLTFKECC